MCFHRATCTEIFSRHRFTATLLTQLVFHFQSPHKILNGVVNAYCGFRPSDAELFVEDEQNVEEIDAIHDDIQPFNFSKILKGMFLVPVFSVLT